MDYTALIISAIVTIVFTTFIAPILAKLGTLRDEIADTDFPIKTDDEDSNVEIDKQGVILNKKLTQYTKKYDEIRVFLKYFYIIIATLFVVQIYITFANPHTYRSFVPLLVALFVIVILSLSLKTFLLPPWKLRSIPWLADAGIAPVYTNHLLSPILILNDAASNTLEDSFTKLSLNVKHLLSGFWYVVTIESVDGRHLYYLCAGRITKYIAGGSLVSGDGQQSFNIDIAKMELKPNDYKARVLVFIAPFSGKYSPSEAMLNFKVPDKGLSPRDDELVELNHKNKDYSFIVAKGKIKEIDYNERQKKEEAIHALVTSLSFVKYLRKAKRPFTVGDRHGNLDRHTIDSRFTKYNITKCKIKRLLTLPSNRRTYLKLT